MPKRCRTSWHGGPDPSHQWGTVPLVGRSSVVSILMVVVLPAPFGPRKAKISPGGDVEFNVIDGHGFAELFGKVCHPDHD